jgi:uncharacterized phage protein gp47/JayE
MSFNVLTLAEARKIARDYVVGKLQGSARAPGNSRLRVLSDNNAGFAQLVLLYVKWLSLQFLPDKCEADWLLRHANIWLSGAKAATYAQGTLTLTGLAGVSVPIYTRILGPLTGVEYETQTNFTLGSGPTVVSAVALTAGKAGNADPGTAFQLSGALANVDGTVIVVTMEGGTDAEATEDLRARVLFRIQKPPMGGDADDYVAWAKEFPGVTRAWASPQEMGIGTMTVRVMMDDLRAGTGGLPTTDDLTAIKAYIDARRPVTVKDFFLEAPIFEPVSFTIGNLDTDDSATRAAITANVAATIKDKAAPAFALNGVPQPAQTIFAAWVSDAILQTPGVTSFDLTMSDHAMPNPGNMATLGSVTFV